ncbi:hypothetical protein GNI_080070, partial [Gregarina niphandrodes]
LFRVLVSFSEFMKTTSIVDVSGRIHLSIVVEIVIVLCQRQRYLWFIKGVMTIEARIDVNRYREIVTAIARIDTLRTALPFSTQGML